MKKDNFLVTAIYWFHLPFVLIWVGLFFVPTSLWQGKVVFHFWYILFIFFVQVVWGVILSVVTKTKNFLVCPITTFMQWARGYSISDPRNIGHTYITEVSEHLRMKVSGRAVSILAVVTFCVVSMQFFLLN